MPVNVKRVWCDFFQCQIINSRADLPARTMEQVFEQLLTQHRSPDQNTVRELGGKAYELRDIETTSTGYRGVIAKYKKADLPHAAIPGGEERELDLAEDEQLLDKTFFSYYSDYALIILQRNRFAINPMRFGRYLSQGGYNVSLNPIIEAADLRRLMADDVNIRVAEISIARPTNPALFEGLEHNFNNSIMQSLGVSNAAKINLTMRGDGHSDSPEQRYLDSGLKRAFLEMKDRFDVSKAQLELEDAGGVVHPLDLVTDRLVYDEVIEFDGRYPSASRMQEVIDNARNVKEPEILSYFGALDETRIG
ncbi:DUF6731 family protein [Marinobacterium stanieri]|uniref:Uncharacterized protein n=1 Tax=Marinobacterium stanieri TaxID=49186 RepID=A0A1N6RNZ5_9GAMM|nr:DUF6731 family protein [Marinobacterium stanieri]SIQ30521.1 hypothetical protein SAMN05421647_103441 [Marinobacterium stanieri]